MYLYIVKPETHKELKSPYEFLVKHSKITVTLRVVPLSAAPSTSFRVRDKTFKSARWSSECFSRDSLWAKGNAYGLNQISSQTSVLVKKNLHLYCRACLAFRVYCERERNGNGREKTWGASAASMFCHDLRGKKGRSYSSTLYANQAGFWLAESTLALFASDITVMVAMKTP